MSDSNDDQLPDHVHEFFAAAPKFRSASGRIDASIIADYLEVHLDRVVVAAGAPAGMTPDAPELQAGLVPIAKALELITEVIATRESVLRWIRKEHPHAFGNTIPIDLLLGGKADVLINCFEGTQYGEFS